MNIEDVRNYCLSKYRSSESMPFDDVNLVMKVEDKMFAMICLDKACVVLKCDPDKAIELRDAYHGVEEAWHFNKKYWNQIWLNSDVDDELLRQLIDHSLAEVVAKWSKKRREEYGQL